MRSLGVSLSIFRVVPYFDEPVGQVKIQTTSKNTQRYYTPKRLMSYLSSNCFFVLSLSAHFS